MRRFTFVLNFGQKIKNLTMKTLGKTPLETTNIKFLVRGFCLGVIAISLFSWYKEGIYSQLISTGFSWMFFIYFSFQFMVFSWLLERTSIVGIRNIIYTVGLVMGLVSITDTIWVVLNDHFVRNLFVNGFRIGWFMSPHMSRNVFFGLGLFVYYKLFRNKIMTLNKVFLTSIFCYVLLWLFYVSVGLPDWRQPVTLTVLNKFEAFTLQQFGFRGFASLVFSSPFLQNSLWKNQ